MNSCPKCAANCTAGGGDYLIYDCNSYSEKGSVKHESWLCIARELDQLAERCRRLEKKNQLLSLALVPLADVPLEELGWENKPKQPLHVWNDHMLYVHQVMAARNALRNK